MSVNSLSSIQDNFIFNFPQGFVPDIVEDKYKIFLENLRNPYSSVLDYLNHTIKDVTISGLATDIVSQKKLYGKSVNYRSSKSPYDLYNREFTVGVKNVDSNLSYFLFAECLQYHYISAANPFINDFKIIILDLNSRELFNIFLKEVLFTAQSELQLAYNAGADTNEKSYTLSFTCNRIDIKLIPYYGSTTDDGVLIEKYSDILDSNME